MYEGFRKIIHIDMDAFYASVEQRDHPEWKGKPIAVGGGGRRGVITTASYEARKFGIRSAMPGFKAKKLCPELIFAPLRFPAYKEVSKQIRIIFRRYTDMIEPLSLDEAFLDVTENKIGETIATRLAERIRQDVLEETQLTCSAGISYCKFLAKIASDINKPNGLTVIKPHQAEQFIEQLPIRKFFGIGRVTARKMEALNIHKGTDLKNFTKLELAQRFGKMGRYYYDIVRGIDNRPVQPHRVTKSIGVERTFSEDLDGFEDIHPELIKVLEMFYNRLEAADNFGRTITLKVKTENFRTLTRSHSKEYFIKEKDEITEIANTLLDQNIDTFESIRLIGLSASNLEQEEMESNTQLSLQFLPTTNNEKTLIIFDVDDTLLNSMKLDSQAFSEAYDELFGQPLATIDWSKYPHVTDTTIFNHAYSNMFGSMPDHSVIKHFEKTFVDKITKNRRTRPESFQEVPGAKSLVDYLLSNDDYLVGIATGGWEAPARTKLLHFGFDLSKVFGSYADDKITREEILSESIDKASKNNHILRSVYVGDALWDVRTTRNMNLDFVGIRFRGDPEVLYNEGAKVVIKDYSDHEKFFEAVEKASPPETIN